MSLNSKRVQLLDNKRLITQLYGLERRTARGGKDSIDHGPGQHDDVANAVAGALVMAAGKGQPMIISDKVLRLSAMPLGSYGHGHVRCFSGRPINEP